MADRYWVGGTGNWDTTSTTNWSATSGGTGGASVPTLNDDVYLDANSGVGTITTTASVSCKSFYCNNKNTGKYSGTLVLGTAAFQSFNSYGNFILSSSMTLTMTQLVYLVIGSSPGGIWNVDFAGIAYGASYTIALGSSTSTTINLLNDITYSGTGTGVQFDISATLITNNYNVYMKADNGNAYVTFSLSNNSRLGSSVFTVSTNTVRVLNNSDAVWESSTILVNKTAYTTTTTIDTSLSGNGVAKIGRLKCQTDTTVTGNVTIGACTIVGPSTPTSTIRTVNFNADATGYPIINGNFFTESTAGNRRIFISSSNYGLGQTIAVNGTTNLVDVDFRDIYVVGKSAPISGTRIGNRGNNTGISFTPAKNVYSVYNGTASVSWYDNIWSATSGGTVSLDNFPLPQDTTIIQNNSLTGISLNAVAAGNYIGSIDMSARTSAMSIAFNFITTCYGNWTNGSGTTLSGTLALTFSGGGTQTITSAGKTFTCPINIDTYGGTVQLADALTLGAGGLQLGVNNGTFDTLNKNVTFGVLSSSNSNLRTIKLGSSTITNINSGASYSLTDTRNLTFDAGTSTILFTGILHTLASGGLTFYNVSFTSASSTTHGIEGVNTFNNLSVTSPSAGIHNIVFSANQTINGTLTCVGASAVRRIYLLSNTMNTQRRLTVNSLSSTDCDFRDIVIAGNAAGSFYVRAGDCGNNSGITFPSPKTVYWNLAGLQNWSATGWATSSGGTPATANFPLAQDTVVFDNAGAVGTISFDFSWNVGTLDMSARTSAMSIQINNLVIGIYGDLKNGTGVTWLGSLGTFSFSKIGTQTITSNGTAFAGGTFLMFRPGSYVQLADAFTFNGSISYGSGTFDAVIYNVSVSGLSCGTTPLAPKLKLGTATWTLTGTTNTFFIQGTAAVVEGSATVVLSNNTTTSRDFGGNVGVYIQKLIIGGATSTSTTTINGANTFGEIASTKTVAHTIAFGFNAQTFGKWSVTGTAGNVVTITGSSAANVIAGPAVTGIDYLAMGSWGVSTTSPGEFYAGANSTGTAAAPVFRTAAPAPRTLYWVGGTGNWSSTTKWATSSGGASGAAIPTSLDTVTFDSASNATAYTATIDAGVTIARCAAFTVAGPTSGNVTWAGSVPIAFHGNVSFAATGITNSYTGTMNWAGNSSYTFTTNGLALLSPITVLGINSTWTIGSALNTTNVLTVTYGNFNTSASNYNIIALLLSSNNSMVRGISLNGSTFTSTASGNIINFGTITNLTFNAGTSLIDILGNSLTFGGGGLTFYNVSITAGLGAAGAIQGANIFNNLTITAQTNLAAWPLTFNANQTINGTLTLNAGTAAAYRTLLASDTIGTQRTLTCAAISSVTDIDFRDINFAGDITLPVTGTRLGDCKGNSNITFDAGKTVYYGQAGSTSWGTAGSGSWSATSGGALNATQFPLAQDTAVFPAATYPASGSTTSINAAYNIGTIDMSLRTTNTMTLTVSSAPNVYGNWITGTGITFSGTSVVTLAGRTSQTVTNAGKIWSMPTIINSPGGSVTLQDSWATSCNFSSPVPMSFIAGTFDANGYNVTFATTINSNAGFSTSGALAKTLAMGSGTWTFPGSGTMWTNTATNITVTGTGTINLTSSSAKSFEGSGYYSGITLNQGGAGALTISGSNTFKNITNSYNATGATSIALGTTIQTLSQFTATGAAGKLLTITGTAASTPATLVYTGSGSIPTIDYVVPIFIKAYPLTSTWSVGANSINGGSLGLTFPTVVSQKPLGSFMTFF